MNMTATQAMVAQLVGVSQQSISALMRESKIPSAGTLGEIVIAYCERLRNQAAGRLGTDAGTGALDLVQERAALARSQRLAQELKNDIAHGNYAPIGVLTDVLATTSAAVVDRFDQLEGALKKAAPDLSDEALGTVLTVIASARNAWIRGTAQLVDRSIDDLIAAEQADESEPDDED